MAGIHRNSYSALLVSSLIQSLILSLILSSWGAAARAQTEDSPFLGVFTEPVDAGRKDSGLRITYIYPHSTGASIGLAEGDEIVAVNDVLIANRDQFIAELRNNNVGGTVRFVIRREAEQLQIKGKIQGYSKTMERVQEDLRRQVVGKPLPPLPQTLWWNPTTAKLEERKDSLAHIDGKIGVLIWYDDCSYCQKERYEFLAQLQKRNEEAAVNLPVAFTGIYHSDRQLEESNAVNLEHARKLYALKKPQFPAGVTHYPKDVPPPKDRYSVLFVHNHGVVVVDPTGKVAYLQAHGAPDPRAIQAAVTQLYVEHFVKKETSGAGQAE